MRLRWIWLFTLLSVGALWAQTNLPASTQRKLDYILERTEEQVNITADFYWHEGLHRHLMRTLFIMIEINPGNIESFSNLGYLLISYDQPNKAFAIWDRGIKVHPKEYDLYYDAGFWYFHQKKNYPKAVEYLEKAIKYNAPPFVWKVLAHTYDKMGQYEKSLAIWEKVRQLDPSDVAVEHNVRRIKAKLSGGKTP